MITTCPNNFRLPLIELSAREVLIFLDSGLESRAEERVGRREENMAETPSSDLKKPVDPPIAQAKIVDSLYIKLHFNIHGSYLLIIYINIYMYT